MRCVHMHNTTADIMYTLVMHELCYGFLLLLYTSAYPVVVWTEIHVLSFLSLTLIFFCSPAIDCFGFCLCLRFCSVFLPHHWSNEWHNRSIFKSKKMKKPDDTYIYLYIYLDLLCVSRIFYMMRYLIGKRLKPSIHCGLFHMQVHARPC